MEENDEVFAQFQKNSGIELQPGAYTDTAQLWYL